MKRIIISMVMYAALLGCSKSEITESNGPSAIYFGTNVMSTKAVIDSDVTGKPTAEVSGIQILRSDGATANWDTVTKVETTGSISTSNTFTIANAQFMKANRNNANFMAYYPAGDAAPKSDKVVFTITGKEDILVAPSVAATYASPVCTLAFAHQLAQVELKVVAKDAVTATLFGHLTAASIDADSKLELTLSTGAVAATGNTKSNFNFYNGDTPFASSAVTTEGLTVGRTMMLAGTLSSISMTFANRPKETYSLTNSLTLVAGSKHLITATVTAKGITFTTSIAAWSAGGAGEIEL